MTVHQPEPITDGLCRCGCGQPTEMGRFVQRRYVEGHFHAQILRNRAAGKPSSGQYERQKLRLKIKTELLEELRLNRSSNRDAILKKFEGRGFRKEGLSMMLREEIGYQHRWNREDLQMPAVAPKKKAPPQYERREIPYEFETEIPMLVNQRYVASLDAPLSDDGGSYHEKIGHNDGRFTEYFQGERDESQDWVKAWVWSLPPVLKRVARDLMAGEPVTKDEEIALRAEALTILSLNTTP